MKTPRLIASLRAVNADPATVAAIVEWLRAGGANDIVETHPRYLRDLADTLEAAAREAHNG